MTTKKIEKEVDTYKIFRSYDNIDELLTYYEDFNPYIVVKIDKLITIVHRISNINLKRALSNEYFENILTEYMLSIKYLDENMEFGDYLLSLPFVKQTYIQLIDDLIYSFEDEEDYEKCFNLLKYKNGIMNI